ncbi:MAG: pyridoxal-phosphate dependent enzyme [Acidimicrobiales bacterium]|jgi:threonine synthase
MELPTEPRQDAQGLTTHAFSPSSSPELASSIVCGGCGSVIDASEPYPFRCPRSGDDGDHVLRRVLDVSRLAFPLDSSEPNPFVRWRGLFHAYHLATAHGMRDQAYVDLVRDLDNEVARVDGHGFVVTPFTAAPALTDPLETRACIWVKDETRNVAGSHKARHMFGLLIHLEVVRLLGMTEGPLPPLAIASCGNAALAAAVVAAAGHRRLLVFVPTDAEPAVLGRLRALGAEITVCPREVGVVGDPSYHSLQAAIADGALPFTCQGNENGLAIEGGETLGYEMAAVLAGQGRLDHVVVQVGGGALASAVAQGLSESAAFGVLAGMPRVHTVQTAGAWPLARAFELVAGRLPAKPGREEVHAAVQYAAAHRSEFMWPWETVPHSLAHGILDDETYDWVAVVEAMLMTGGQALVVNEDEIAQANGIGVEATGIEVDPTGSAGLAGLAQLCRRGLIGPDERAAVLFTGARR